MTYNLVHRCVWHMSTESHQRFIHYLLQKWVILGFLAIFDKKCIFLAPIPLYENLMTWYLVQRCIEHMLTGPHWHFLYRWLQKWVILGCSVIFDWKMYIFGFYALVCKPNHLKFGRNVNWTYGNRTPSTISS